MRRYLIILVHLLLLCFFVVPYSTAQVKVIAAEYFYDTDPGVGKGIAIPALTSDTSVSVDFTAGVNGLSVGFHRINFRAFDSTGNWGIISSQLFYLNPLTLAVKADTLAIKLTRAEYFIDTDPGVGKGIPFFMLPGDSVNLSFGLNTINLDSGNHKVAVRLRNLEGQWGAVSSANILVYGADTCNTPVAAFLADTVSAGNPTTFTNQTAATGDSLLFEWQINDTVITTVNTAYTFASAGTYTVTLKANNTRGCQSVSVKQIHVGSILTRTITPQGRQQICDGDSLALLAPAGVSYIWNTGDTAAQIYVLRAGSYSVVYTDVNGNPAVSEPVIITLKPAINISLDISPATGAQNNGSAGIKASGGNSFIYTYNWSNGITKQIATDLLSGNYTVVVSDNVCPVTIPVAVPSIAMPDSGIVAIEYFVDTDSGPGSGTLLKFAQSDTVDFFANIPVNALSLGKHVLAIRAKYSSGNWGAVKSSYFEIGIPDSLRIVEKPTKLLRGEYFIDSEPGIGKGIPITFAATDSLDKPLNINLPVNMDFGMHHLFIRTFDDSLGWGVVSQHLFAVNNEPEPVNTTVFKFVDAEYFFDNDPGIGKGKALKVTPGDSLSFPATIPVDTFSVGSHQIAVRAKDISGIWTVVGSATFNIIVADTCVVPIPLFVSNVTGTSVTFVNTSQQTDGATTYAWDIKTDNSVDFTSTNATFDYGQPGIYNVSLKADNGRNCQSENIERITIGASASTNIVSTNATEFCFGDSAVLTAPTGSGYQWSTGDTVQSIVVRKSGLYHALYKNGNGIDEQSNDISIKVNPVLTANILVGHANQGQNNGSAIVNAIGGNAWVFNYLWSNGSTKQTAVDLAPGAYTVQVTDGVCPQVFNVQIDNDTASHTGLVDAEYFFDTDPGIGSGTKATISRDSLSVSSLHIPILALNKGPHTLAMRVKEENGFWSSVQTYSIFVTDAISDTIKPDDGKIIAAEYFYDDNDPGGGKAQALNVFPGKTIDYNFVIPTNGLAPGMHTASVRVYNDQSGWSANIMHRLFIESEEALVVAENTEYPLMGGEYFIDNDPGTGQAIPLIVFAGYAVDQPYTINLDTIPAGTHKLGVRFRDINGNWGAVQGSTFTIVPPAGCLVPSVSFASAIQDAGSASQFNFSGTNIHASSKYFWDFNSDGTVDFEGAAANFNYTNPGNYSVSLKVDNGSNCVVNQIEQVNVGPLPLHSIAVAGNLTGCQPDSVTLTAPAGSAYLWSNSSKTQQIVVHKSGEYMAYFTAPNGKVVATDTIFVDLLPQPNVITEIIEPNAGFSNGSIGLQVSGGSSYRYLYNWSTGSHLPAVTGLSQGAYNVQVTDGKCPHVLNITLNDDPAPAVGIIRAEYFIDTDPGAGKAANALIKLSDPMNSFVDIATDTLSIGRHIVGFRVQDDSGNWSVASTHIIFALPNDTVTPVHYTAPTFVKAEYYFNSADPGVGNATPLSINAGDSVIDMNYSLSAASAINGVNTIYIRAKDNEGRWSVISQQTFNVCDPTAAPNAGVDTMLCENGTLSLHSSNVANADSYYWTGPNGFTSTSQFPVINNALKENSGAYYVMAVKGGNCYSKPDTINVSVNSYPGPAGFIAGQKNIKDNDTAIYFVPVIPYASQYEWVFEGSYGIMAGNFTNNIAVKYTNALNNGAVNVRGTNACGTGAWSDTLRLNVFNTKPVAAGSITGTDTVCAGEQLVVYKCDTISRAVEYVWTLPTGAYIVSGAFTDSITVSYAANAISGNITVYGKNPAGSGTASAPLAIKVNALPAITIPAIDPVCASAAPLTISGYSPAGGTFSGSGVSSGGVFDPAITGSGLQQVYYHVTNAQGCSDSLMAEIYVKPVINDVLSISGPAVICQGEMNLHYQVQYVDNADGYVWSFPDGSIDTTLMNSVVGNFANAALESSLSVYAYNSCGNGPTSNLSITIHSKPAISLAATDQSRCDVGFVQLNALPSAGNLVQWSFDKFVNVAVIDTVLNYNLKTSDKPLTTYFRAFNNTTGCAGDLDSAVIIAHSLPLANAGLNLAVCQGTSVTLSAVGGISYAWNNGIIQDTAFVPDTTKSYIVDVTNAFGCHQTDTVLVTVFPNPIISINSSRPTVFCEGDSTTLSVANGFSSYLWNNGPTSYQQNVFGSGNYSVEVTDVNGCKAITSQTITVNPVDTVTVNATICESAVYTLPDASGVSLSGTYITHVVSSLACDSVVITQLTVNQVDTLNVNAVICEGDMFILPDASVVSAAGTYVSHLLSSLACDSVVITNLTVNPVDTTIVNVAICEGNTHTLPDASIVITSGTYVTHLVSSLVCDSVVITQLVVNPVDTIVTNAVICEGNSYTLPDASMVSVAGTYTTHLASSFACDSVVVTQLAVNQVDTITVNATICEGKFYSLPDTSKVSTGGTYVTHLASSLGCDSVISTQLTVNQVDTVVVNATICSGSTYTLPDASVVDTAGSFENHLVSSLGCDSVIFTNLTVNKVYNFVDSVTIYSGNEYILPDGSKVTTDGTYTTKYQTVSTCDSIYVTVVKVDKGCYPGFTVAIDNLNALNVMFTDTSKGKYDDYYWDFGDGQTSKLQNPSHLFARNGVYTVSLSVRNSLNDCNAAFKTILKVGATACRAMFTNLVSGLNVSFTNTSEGTLSLYYWDFGDGNYATSPDVQHSYAVAGNYRVSLTVTDVSQSCTDNVEVSLSVGNIDCNAGFSWYVNTETNKVYFIQDQAVANTASTWTFGDGKLSVTKNPVHQYPKPGYYNVGLNVYNQLSGCMDYVEHPVLVSSEGTDCEANFVYMVNPNTKKVMFFDNSRGNIKRYVWNFGQDSIALGKNTSFTYSKPGYYNVCHTVSNSFGVSDMTCKQISVATDGNTMCKARFDYSIDSATRTVSFKDRSLGEPDKWTWKFGEGNPFTDQNPVYSYSKDGYYLVKQTIENSANLCSDRTYKFVAVNKFDGKIMARFGFDIRPKNTKSGGYPVDLVGAGMGDQAKLRWTFGDGSASDTTTNTPSHEYSQPGVYEICYEVADPVTGDTAKECQQITILGNEVLNLSLETVVNMYPVPVSAKLIVESNQPILNVEVINLQGVTLFNAKASKVLKLPISMEKLPSGLYNIVVYLTNGNVIHHQVFKE